jgi:hypothetical protein
MARRAMEVIGKYMVLGREVNRSRKRFKISDQRRRVMI